MNSINEVLNELKDDIISKPEAFHRKKPNFQHPAVHLFTSTHNFIVTAPKPQQSAQTEKFENKAYLQQKEYFLEITKDKLLTTLSSQDHHPFSWNNFPLYVDHR